MEENKNSGSSSKSIPTEIIHILYDAFWDDDNHDVEGFLSDFALCLNDVVEYIETGSVENMYDDSKSRALVYLFMKYWDAKTALDEIYE